MEIDTQQMEALLRLQEQQAALPRKNGGQGAGFETILNQQIHGFDQAQPSAEAIMSGTAQNEALNRIMFNPVGAEETVDPDTAVLQAAFDQASGTLDLWDSYTRTLGASTTDTALRDAWGVLEGIDAQVSQMRANPVVARSAALDSLLNELEIMTATEKFKFNRGDYSI